MYQSSKIYVVFAFLSTVLVFPDTISAFVSLAPSNRSEVCDSKECQLAAQNLKTSMDTSINPCDNFYLYACGNWPKSHEIPSGQTEWDPILIRTNQNNRELLGFLKQNNSDEEPQAVHKARKLFNLCLTGKANYKREMQLIKRRLSDIGLPEAPPINETENATFDYTTASAKARRALGVDMFFQIKKIPDPYNVSVNVVQLTEPALDFIPLYSEEIETSSEIIKTLKILNEGRVKMCKNSSEIICKVFTTPTDSLDQRTRDEYREYKYERRQIISKQRSSNHTFYNLQKLQNITDTIAEQMNTTIPKFVWTKYIEQIFTNTEKTPMNFTDPEKIQIMVKDISFVEDMIKFIYNKTLQQHEFGLWWKVVHNLLHYSDSDIAKSELTCLQSVTEKSVFGLATSYYYTTKPEYSDLTSEVQEMVLHMKDSFIELINQANWMDKNTKEKAMKKLNSMKSFIGYPSAIKTTKILDEIYDRVEIPDNWVEALENQVRYYVMKQLTTHDVIKNYEDSWEMTPNKVAAQYWIDTNTIIIPAGIIGSTMLMHDLKSIDYAQIGFISAHEITHGFDDDGHHYNENGELEEWWDPKTLDMFNNKTRCLLDAYKNYDITFNGITQKVSSTGSLSENIADNGGFKKALFAFRKFVRKNQQDEPRLVQFENFTNEQIFTLAFANTWCENRKKPISKFSKYSPKGVRVNGVLKNSEEFSKIWNCPEDSNMNPKNKCSLW